MSLSHALPSQLIQAVMKYSPIIADALGMPIAGTVVTILAHAFGVDTPTVENVSKAIQNAPDAELKIKQIEVENKALFMKYEIDDRASARNLAIQNKNSDKLMHFVALLYLLGFFTYIGLESGGVILRDTQIISDLHSGCLMILGFYFGASYVQNKKG